MGFFGKIFVSEDKRFYELVKISLQGPTTGEGSGIQLFTFDEASMYGYTTVNSSCFEHIDDNTVCFPYDPFRASKDDTNYYKVTIRRARGNLAEFHTKIDPISSY